MKRQTNASIAQTVKTSFMKDLEGKKVIARRLSRNASSTLKMDLAKNALMNSL